MRILILLCIVLFTLSYCDNNPCPPIYIYDSTFGYCYFFVKDKLSYDDSVNFCQSIGSGLVVVENTFQNNIIYQFAGAQLSITNGFYFVNAFRIDNGTWYSSYEGTVTPMNYSKWSAGEPYIDRNCGSVQVANGMWKAQLCTDTFQSVCGGPSGTIIPINNTTPSCPSYCTVSPSSPSFQIDRNVYTEKSIKPSCPYGWDLLDDGQCHEKIK